MFHCPECCGVLEFGKNWFGHNVFRCVKCGWLRMFGAPVRVVKTYTKSSPFGVAPRISCADCRG